MEEEIRNQEFVRLEDVFSANGYPVSRVQAVLHTRTRPEEKKNDEESRTLVLPYIQGLSERITKVCQKVNIRTAFKSQTTLRNTLTHVKGILPPEERRGVIYSIPCECGAVYIGETCRTIKQRLEEHKRAVRIGDPSNAIALHTNSNLHSIQWGESKVIEQELNWKRRRVKEAIHINVTPNTMNTDLGLLINPTWHTSLKVMTSSSQD